MHEYVTIEDVNEAYLVCRRHKGRSRGAVEYMLDYELNNLRLWQDLNDGKYAISPSRAFCVTRPKLREVFCADFRDRVVHHLLAIKFLPLIEAQLTDSAYACRVGMGVEYGVQRLANAVRTVSQDFTKETYVLKCDIQGFFMSIDRERLYGKLRSLVEERWHGKDKEWWLKLWRQVILNRPEKNCQRIGDVRLWGRLPKSKSLFHSGGKGLPIGNLPSQILANLYLSDFDDWARGKVGGDNYGRYVDDWYMVSKDKGELLRLLSEARERLAGIGLTLHPKKIYLQPVRHGVEFTGAVVKPYGILPSRRIKNNLQDMLGEWNEDKSPDIGRYVCRMNSYMGFLRHRTSYGYRRKIWSSIRRKEDIVNVNMAMIKLIDKQEEQLWHTHSLGR